MCVGLYENSVSKLAFALSTLKRKYVVLLDTVSFYLNKLMLAASECVAEDTFIFRQT